MTINKTTVENSPSGEFLFSDKFHKHLKRLSEKNGIPPYFEFKKMRTDNNEDTGSIPLYNRFNPLAKIDNNNMDTTELSNKNNTQNDQTLNTPNNSGASTSGTNNITPSTPKPTPIIVTSAINYVQFHGDLKNILKNEKFRVQYTRQTTKIIVETMEAYNTLLIALRDGNFEFITHTPRALRPQKIVLKASPHMEAPQIVDILNSKNIHVKDCTKMMPKIDTSDNNPPKSRSFLITTTSKETVNQLKEIDGFDNVQFNWQRYARKNPVTQCYRCQGLGHGSGNCNKKPACLKCAQQHLTKDCNIKIRSEENAKKLVCVNCRGPHPANFSNCPIILEYLDKTKYNHVSTKTQTKPNTQNSKEFPQLQKTHTPSTRYAQNNISYAAITQNKYPTQIAIEQNTYKHTPQQNNTIFQTNDLTTLLKEIKELNEAHNLDQLFAIVRELKHGLNQCTNITEKIQFLAHIATKYSV